jgi:hypothetical protein
VKSLSLICNPAMDGTQAQASRRPRSLTASPSGLTHCSFGHLNAGIWPRLITTQRGYLPKFCAMLSMLARGTGSRPVLAPAASGPPKASAVKRSHIQRRPMQGPARRLTSGAARKPPRLYYSGLAGCVSSRGSGRNSDEPSYSGHVTSMTSLHCAVGARLRGSAC